MLRQIVLSSAQKLVNLKINDKLVYLIISFWLITKLIDFTTLYASYQSVFFLQLKINRALCFLLVLLYLFKWKDGARDKLNLIGCIIFVTASYYLNKFTKAQLVFDLFFIPLFLCQFLDKKKFYKYILIFFCLFFLASLCLYSFDLIKDSQIFLRAPGVRRYALGYIHPNALGFYVLVFCFYYVMFKTTFRIFDYVLLVVLAFFCYKVPNSITSSSLIILLSFFVLCSNLFLRKKLCKRTNLILLFLSLTFVTAVLFFTYYITFTETFKSYLQNMPGSIWARFELSKKGYEIFGFSLFGRYMDFLTMAVGLIQKYGPNGMWLILDCSYFYLPINHGIIVFMIFMAMLVWSLVRGVLNHQYLYALIIIVMVIYGVSETTIFRPMMMPVFAYTFFSATKRIVNK